MTETFQAKEMMQAEVTVSQRSLSQQLYQAYVASMKEAGPDHTTEKDYNHSRSIVSEASVEENVRSSSCDITDPPVATFDILGATTASVLPTPSFSIMSYQLHPSTIQAWDQIWELTHEVAHSVMVTQAEIVCDLAKQDCRIRVNDQGDVKEEHSSKRRKVVEDLMLDNEKQVIKNVTTSNRNCNSCEDYLNEDSSDEGETVAISSLSSSTNNDDPDVLLTRNAERMIRMTNYISEMERIHGLFRLEMENLPGKTSEESFS